MAPTTPTTKDISDLIIAQLEASLNQTIPLLPKAFNRVLSKALGAVFVTLYKYAGWMFLQIFVQTASSSSTIVNGQSIVPLTLWGRLIGVGDPVSATHAEQLIDITVQNQTGSLPSGSQLIGQQNGVTYITIGSVALTAPVVQATIRAVSDQGGGGGAGVIGNLDPGATVSFANPLASVARDATVDSQTVTGADAQSTESYRQSIIDRFQKRVQGGALVDYDVWGMVVAGIVNVYPYTSMTCPGQVDNYVEATPASSGSPDGIPTGAQLQAVLDAINLDDAGLATNRPANALPNTFAITRTQFDVTVSGITNVDDLAQVESDITSAVEQYFADREPYILGVSILPKKNIISSSQVSGVVSDIVDSYGGLFIDAVVKEGVTVISQRTLGTGEKAKSTMAFI